MYMVQNKHDVIDLIKSDSNNLAGFGIIKIGLFGSFIHGTQSDDSDVDLLLEFQKGKKTYRNFINAAEALEKLLGRKVEVLTPESLSQYIAPHIQRNIEYVQVAN